MSKNRAAQKTRFKVSVGLNTLFHFFEKTCQSHVLKKNHFKCSNSNNCKCRSWPLLPTVKKEGTLLAKNEKPPFGEIKDLDG